MPSIEWIGWIASIVLIATLLRQMWTQSRSGNDAGVSRWLFVGQIAASALFLLYSVLLHSWVFSVSNAMILLTAVAGQVLAYRRRQRRSR